MCIQSQPLMNNYIFRLNRISIIDSNHVQYASFANSHNVAVMDVITNIIMGLVATSPVFGVSKNLKSETQISLLSYRDQLEY